ncbi:thioredoxin M-type, chloroplastic-like [Malania oleifera]|uniref:thioredoxin M-type, chloroplastic-like n=1 Tax=Malania oleifera TaxID=397392 RepID=UPI0025AEBDD2|nr:thioredoxin M-type, chloroplastic-like [Malania oleifera]
MALEKYCFQLSTVSTARAAGVFHSPHPFSHDNILNLRTCNGSNKSIPSFCASSPRWPRSSIVCKARKVLDEVQVVTDSSWENLVVASERPVLVEFWAPWCGPCRMIAPVIDELAKESARKIACYKLNTDDSPNIASQYGIRSIPTVLFFKNGEKKEGIIGAVPKSTLTASVEKHLNI